MAFNPFEQLGLKEVADVIVYNISGQIPVPVMFFDTLKISNIEQTAESTDARGGKGNPKLISWDYGKEITLTLQDALLSSRSLSLLTNPLASDAATTFDGATSHAAAKKIKKAEIVTLGASSTFMPKYSPASTTGVYILESGGYATKGSTYYAATTGVSSGDIVRIVYEVLSTTNGTYEIVITPEKFPGTYMIVGDTVVRNKKTGLDEGFQFIIPKAKFGSDVTLTMESEGDPSVFDMNITVLKADNGSMMSLVRYDIGDAAAATAISNLT